MSFITTEENFLLQAALRRNKSRIISFALIGIALLSVAAIAPPIISTLTHSDETSALSYTNIWFWAWVIAFDISLVFALIKVTDVRYWAIKKDLMTLEKETLEAPIEGVYFENNDTQTNFMLQLPDNKKKTYYYMDGALREYQRGYKLNITYAKQSRVILAIHNKIAAKQAEVTETEVEA
ncbi:MAG TPA: hypothetical protein VGC22_06580 [Chitinophaga sp.]